MKINFKNKLLLTVATLSLAGSAYSLNGNSLVERSDFSLTSSMSQYPIENSANMSSKFNEETCAVEDLSYSRVFSDYVNPQIQNKSVQVDGQKTVIPPVEDVCEPLAQRLFRDTSKMEQMERLPQAMNSLKNFKMNDALRQNLMNGIDTKISAVNDARAAFEPSLTADLMASFFGTRIEDKVTELKEALDKALGSLAVEFKSKNGTLTSNTKIAAEIYLKKALGFLEAKKSEIRRNEEQTLLKHAAEVEFIQKLGMTDYTVETVLSRSTGSTKEIAGVVLYNKITAQAVMVMADGTASTFADLGQGATQEEANIGMQGKSDHLNRYASIHPQVRHVMNRLVADAKNNQLPLDVITVGENNGSADALQAAFNLKKEHGDAVQVGALGFDARTVYTGPSAQKVQDLLGKENIVFSRHKSWISASYDYLMGYETVGTDVKSVAKPQISALQAPALPAAEEPGLLSRAWSALTSWF